MKLLSLALTLAALFTSSSTAAPVDIDAVDHLLARAVSPTCSQYTIINTRGTGELQGESSGFRTMNSRVRAALSGGTIYNTVYAADFSQISTAATQDIIRQVNAGVASDPKRCFILEGYSQGAAATTNALGQLTGAAFDAVKGVFLIGNPLHQPGLACNVDQNGGTTTRNARGISASFLPGIPSNWVSKTLDVCIRGDGVCDVAFGVGITAQHLLYPLDSATQSLGTSFITKQLGGSA
ncbi:cutinase-like enzyme [Papiliotrema laurentii]|uniref:Cutinase-like enzyme n=1 Tax=Papiliotrema laurentii TaxID=5418 RepID=A0AAD9FW79_PAPLA|nr:cutinase-like enzyme [Papiliotrema laurentii]